MSINLKELTVYVSVKDPHPWIYIWIKNVFLPCNLNFVTDVSIAFVKSLIKSWSSINSYFKPSHVATLKLYTNRKVPINVLSAMPKFQIQYVWLYSCTTVYNCQYKFGILGLEKDLLLITDGTSFDDKKVHMATTISNVILQDIQVKVLLSQLTTVKFLTWFEATNFILATLNSLLLPSASKEIHIV